MGHLSVCGNVGLSKAWIEMSRWCALSGFNKRHKRSLIGVHFPGSGPRDRRPGSRTGVTAHARTRDPERHLSILG
jgi:hypothetical protein